MDGLIDILITIGIFVFFFVSYSSKIKKRRQQLQQQEQQKARQRSARPMVPPTSESEEEPSWHEIFEFEQTVTKQGPSVASSSYEEIPKNQSYFTYETIEPEIKENVRAEETSYNESVEKNVQNIDNEMEKSPQFSLDMKEIYKGVIYSEILKRPYN